MNVDQIGRSKKIAALGHFDPFTLARRFPIEHRDVATDDHAFVHGRSAIRDGVNDKVNGGVQVQVQVNVKGS